jgi:hypothetical protein
LIYIDLQEKCGVKMVMIQDSNTPTAFDKPLRITGDQMKCQRAKEIVLELNASNDDMVTASHTVQNLPKTSFTSTKYFTNLFLLWEKILCFACAQNPPESCVQLKSLILKLHLVC